MRWKPVLAASRSRWKILTAIRSSCSSLPGDKHDDRHWVSGDLGVSEWLLTGTTPDGVRIQVRGCDHWEFRDGKVIRKDSYWKIIDRSL
jgi:hypothetical protein